MVSRGEHRAGVDHGRRSRGRRRRPSHFVREVGGRVAFDLAITSEGRAADLSVEVSPDRGIALHARHGDHDLRLFVQIVDDVAGVAWERTDHNPSGRGSQASHGDLGKVHELGAEDLRAFMWDWMTELADKG